MSSTSGSGIPPSPPPLQGWAAPQAGQTVLVVSVPQSLSALSQPVEVEGEVLRQNADGSVRIQIEDGMIEILTKGKSLAPGQKVELELPAGSPPRTATIKPATPTQPFENRPAEPLPSSASPRTDAAVKTTLSQEAKTATIFSSSPINPPEQPLPLSIFIGYDRSKSLRALSGSPSSVFKDAPLQPGQPIRLTPLSPLALAQMMEKGEIATTTPFSLPSISPGAPPPAAFFLTDGLPKQTGTLLSSLSEKQTPPFPALSSTGSLSLQQAGIAAHTQETFSEISTPILEEKKSASSAASSILPSPSPLEPPPKTGWSVPVTAAAAASDSFDALILSVFPASTSTQTATHEAAALMEKLFPALASQGETATTTDETAYLSPIKKQPDFHPQQALEASRPFPSREALIGTVAGFSPSGLPVVALAQSPSTSGEDNFIPFFLVQFTAGGLETGSHLLLLPLSPSDASFVETETGKITQQATSSTGASPQAIASSGIFWIPSATWPAAQDLYGSLSGIMSDTPGSGEASVSSLSLGRLLPNPSLAASFGAAVLFFTGALRGSDFQSWLGDKRMEALLKTGKGGLLSLFADEASSLARTGAGSEKTLLLSGEWRSYPLPIVWQDQISRAAFHIKDNSQDAEKEEKITVTRFILELDLSRMGGLQLDGLLRGKCLDLIVRTQVPISAAMQDAMRTAYAKALQDSGFHGDIGFQGDIRHWVSVCTREETIGVNV